jgi:hypothetical protein
MSEVINLRRARKAKSRAEAAAQADANRIKHGVSKFERNLGKARADKLGRTIGGHKLEREG